MLRENWSSTMISASRPGALRRQAESSQRAAARCTAPKRASIMRSNSSDLRHQAAGSISSNQKARMVSGEVCRASMRAMIRASRALLLQVLVVDRLEAPGLLQVRQAGVEV